MELEQIRALADLMKKNELTALELSENGTTLKLERRHESAVPAPIAVSTHVQTTPAGPVTEVERPPEEGIAIKAPMVGLFYAAPDPGAEPFVSLGKKVKKGDTLCIIEAMKLMNEIAAEQDGTICKISCTNGQTVEYGEELFRIKPEEN